MKYLATIRCTFDADDELEAQLEVNELVEAAAELLDEQETIDVTQIIPYELRQEVEPAEMVNQLRVCRDMLIKTRVIQLFDLAKGIDQAAWILEHRQEQNFDLSGYDYGAIFDLADKLLGRKSADNPKG